MTKRDLVVSVARKTGLGQIEVAKVLELFLEGIIESLARGETVEFRNFGVFKLQTRKSRIGRNPNRPEHTVVIPERRVVKFKPGKIMRRNITGI
jgi:DNA-binding protein HU-beta/integration host factor subunit alpha